MLLPDLSATVAATVPHVFQSAVAGSESCVVLLPLT